jgi:hypothetical protein
VEISAVAGAFWRCPAPIVRRMPRTTRRTVSVVVVESAFSARANASAAAVTASGKCETISHSRAVLIPPVTGSVAMSHQTSGKNAYRKLHRTASCNGKP